MFETEEKFENVWEDYKVVKWFELSHGKWRKQDETLNKIASINNDKEPPVEPDAGWQYLHMSCKIVLKRKSVVISNAILVR